MFTDSEYRILLSALRREKEVCREVDGQYTHEPYEDTLVDICESIERELHNAQYKYKWHDLRKNPEDLPEISNKAVLTGHVMCGRRCYAVCQYTEYGFEDGINPAELLNMSVIAWREIEPFEREEE